MAGITNEARARIVVAPNVPDGWSVVPTAEWDATQAVVAAAWLVAADYVAVDNAAIVALRAALARLDGAGEEP